MEHINEVRKDRELANDATDPLGASDPSILRERFNDMRRSMAGMSAPSVPDTATAAPSPAKGASPGKETQEATAGKASVDAASPAGSSGQQPSPAQASRRRSGGAGGKPKPKPTPSPKPAPAKGPPAPTKQGKRGRPSRDACLLLRAGLRELATADASASKFFGPEWRNTCRNWTNYLTDVTAMIDGADEPALKEELEVMHKQVIVAKLVLTKGHALGLNSLATAAFYQEKMDWLRMAPNVATSPFSPYMSGLMHSVLAENAKHPEEFWSLCQDSEISQFDPNVEGRLVDIVVGKVMLVTQECSCDDLGLPKPHDFCDLRFATSVMSLRFGRMCGAKAVTWRFAFWKAMCGAMPLRFEALSRPESAAWELRFEFARFATCDRGKPRR